MSLLERPEDQQTPSVHVDDFILDNTLSVTYTTKGTEIVLKDRTEFYASGSSRCSYGLIIIPDPLGWKSGRIRNICDTFAEKDIFCVIPNFHSRGIVGHTQGYFESESLMDYHKSRVLDGNVKPIVSDLVEFMKREKIEKIALLGFDWGSWVVASLLASEMADDFYCGALMQPCLNMEEQRYGGSTAELVCRINRPVLLMPVMTDPMTYTSSIKLLRYKLPTSTVVDYHNMESGFMLHGLISDPRVRKAVHKAIDQIYNYFQLHFQMKPDDFLVGEIEDLGPEAEIKKIQWGKKMKEGGVKLKQFFERTGERIKETFQSMGDSLKPQEDPYDVKTAQTVQPINQQSVSSSSEPVDVVVHHYPNDPMKI